MTGETRVFRSPAILPKKRCIIRLGLPGPTGKPQGEWRATASGAARTSSGGVRLLTVRWSGGLAEGDGKAERLELTDVVEGFAVFVDPRGVVVAAEVLEARGGVGE